MYQRVASPNFDERNSQIDTIVIHSTHTNKEDALRLLCTPGHGSSHYLIDLNGQVYQLVDEDKRAWHAGKSYWRGKSELNHNSIGIEMVDEDDASTRITRFTEPQMKSLIMLLKILADKYQIEPCNIVGHSDIAPDRKDDPGEIFDWQSLFKQGLGMFHGVDLNADVGELLCKPLDSGKAVQEVQKKLSAMGYLINTDGTYNSQTRNVIIAFKRHFNPNNITTAFHELDMRILDELV